MDTNIHGQKNVYGVTVTTNATKLNSNDKRLGLFIRNSSEVDVFLGNGLDVTILNGFPLLADELLHDSDGYDKAYGGVDNWYAVVASGTASVRLIEYTSA